jgi:hypothetical protein
LMAEFLSRLCDGHQHPAGNPCRVMVMRSPFSTLSRSDNKWVFASNAPISIACLVLNQLTGSVEP